MCTVSYVPLGKDHFILTQNRDEGFDRPHSLSPAIYLHQNHSLLYPKDPVGNGTWMATSNNGMTACLLNGAFEKHKRKLPYSKSRGLVLLDIFNYNHVTEFVQEYSFNNIEPFTIIAIDKEKGGYEIIWDENLIHCNEFSLLNHKIWSSSTLYNPSQKNERHKWFYDRLNNNKELNWDKVLDFHLHGGVPYSENSIVMKREKVGTVSITSVHALENNTVMNYLDIQNRIQKEVSIDSTVLK